MLNNDSNLIPSTQVIFADSATNDTLIAADSATHETVLAADSVAFANKLCSTKTRTGPPKHPLVFGNFDSPANVPEFRKAWDLNHQTYIFEDCLVEELQRTVGSGLVPLHTRPGVTWYLAENDILSDKIHSDSGVEGSASNKVFVERLRRAGYFRKQRGTDDGR